MLKQETTIKSSYPSSLAKILKIVSMEYEEDLTSLGGKSHQWLIVRDELSGFMGGICLTPRASAPTHPLLADFCRTLKNKDGWVASHLFCWVSEDLDENKDNAVEKCVAAFYQQLYATLADFCADRNIGHLWFLSFVHQHLSAVKTGLFPFKTEMRFNHRETPYMVALVPTDMHTQALFRKSHTAYHTCMYGVN